jgi:predicted PurR-regulated permease PerM
LSAVLLVASLLGVLAGGWLIGRWAVGVAVVADSVAVGVWALYRNDGQDEPQAHEVQPSTLAGILEKARRSA